MKVVFHILPGSWVPGSACTLVEFIKEGEDMDMALCENKKCPSKGHCYRYVAKPTGRRIYAKFDPQDQDRCDYYIPTQIELPLPPKS